MYVENLEMDNSLKCVLFIKVSDQTIKQYAVELRWGIFLRIWRIFLFLAQDDHLTAGAWAACGLTENKSCRCHQRQFGWRKQFDDLFETSWPEGKETRLRMWDISKPLVSWKAVRGEPQIQSGHWKSSISIEHLRMKASLYSVYSNMDQSVSLSEKNFRLFFLELSYLLKKFVDFKNTNKK